MDKFIKTIKTYKGFDKDLRCRGFQYEVGKEYELPPGENPLICEKGFHALAEGQDPLRVFDYYNPSESGNRSRYCEVEIGGKTSGDGEKVCGEKIRIGAEVGIAGIIKAHFEWVKSHITNKNNADPLIAATAGDYGAATAGDSGAATAGYKGAATAGYKGAATAGYKGAATAGYKGAATAGDSGAATAGDYGAATAGDYGAVTAGDYGAATAGDYGAATAGDYGAVTAGYKGSATAGDSGAATAGDYGAATAGDYGAATSRGSVKVGGNGIGCVRGNSVKAMGGLGAILMIAVENSEDFNIQEWKAFVVDGDVIKADTWYILKDGELVELEEGGNQ